MIRSRPLHIILLLLITAATAFAQPDDEQYELENINFIGNENLSSTLLKTVLVSKETPMFFFQWLRALPLLNLGSGPAYFNPDNVATDLRNLRALYNARGFFEAEVRDSVIHEDAVQLYYIIKEGNPSNYGKIDTESLDDYLHYWKLPALFPFDSTDRYSEVYINNVINNALQTFQNDGYLFAMHDSTVVMRDTVQNTADIDFTFSVGDRYTISKLEINTEGPGAPGVSNTLLREMIGIRKGDTYSLEEVERSQVRLYRTGLFSGVTLQPVTEEAADSLVPLALNGRIGELNELSPELLINNQQNSFNTGLGLQYARKNFLGGARKLTLRGEGLVQNVQNISPNDLGNMFSSKDTTVDSYVTGKIRLEQPYLFQMPLTGSIEFNTTFHKLTNLSLLSYNGKVNLEFEMYPHTFINFLDVYYTADYLLARDILYSDEYEFYNLSFGIDGRSTKVNNLIFPSAGYNLQFIAEEGNVLPYLLGEALADGQVKSMYYKFRASGSYYYSLNEMQRNVLAGKLKIGYIRPFRGDVNEILPLTRFFAGGSNSIRGWATRGLSPVDTYFDQNNLTFEEDAIGGTYLLEASVELRSRFGEALGAALFVDAGNVWEHSSQIRMDKIALATGFGLRYYSSIAAFRIDVGIKTYDPATSDWTFNRKFWDLVEFHFGIGEAF